jgi:hypothetical protein
VAAASAPQTIAERSVTHASGATKMRAKSSFLAGCLAIFAIPASGAQLNQQTVGEKQAVHRFFGRNSISWTITDVALPHIPSRLPGGFSRWM